MRARRAGRGARWLLATVFAAAAPLTAAGLAGQAVPPVQAIGLLPVPDTLTMSHDRTATVPAPGVLANDLNLLGATAILTGSPSDGDVVLASNGGYTYTPDPGFVGVDVFRYRPSGLLTPSTTVTITVVNRAPVAVADLYSAKTGVQLSVPAPGVLANDLDADGDALQAELLSAGGSGSLDLEPDGSFTYKSGGSFVGTITFTYRATDGLAWSASTLVTIVVSSLPTPPPTPTPAPPTPTPAPTAAPTPAPTAAATARPSPSPTPRATSSPRPTSSAPPTPTATPVPGTVATARPSADPSADPSATPAATPSATPTGPAPAPVVPGGPGSGPAGPSPEVDPSPGAEPGEDPRPHWSDDLVVGARLGPFDDLLDLRTLGFGALFEWAVPALVLSVPGLLLLLAILAQSLAGVLWLPVVRRSIGGFGLGRRRRGATLGDAPNA